MTNSVFVLHYGCGIVT